MIAGIFLVRPIRVHGKLQGEAGVRIGMARNPSPQGQPRTPTRNHVSYQSFDGQGVPVGSGLRSVPAGTLLVI